MPHRWIGVSALCCALAACVSSSEQAEASPEPSAGEEAAALLAEPVWPRDVRWSAGARSLGGLVGDFDQNGLPDVALFDGGPEVIQLIRGEREARFSLPELVRQDPLRIADECVAQ